MAAVLGADRMEAMPQIAERVNSVFFKQMSTGAAVRLGGRISTAAGGAVQLTTTDGGVLSVSGFSDLMDGSLPGFVEVVGTKVSDSVVEAAGITPLGENVDAEMWEEALKMARLPQLRALFEPAVVAAA